MKRNEIIVEGDEGVGWSESTRVAGWCFGGMGGHGAGGVRGLAEPAKADELRVGVIGPGSRGQELIRQLLHVPGVRIAAVCDIYEPRYAQVNQLVGSDVPHTREYRELLDRKDLDVIYIATPGFAARRACAGRIEDGPAGVWREGDGFHAGGVRGDLQSRRRTRRALPDWPSISLCAVGAGGGGRNQEGEDWRADARVCVLAPQQQLAAPGAESGPWRQAGAPDQLAALSRDIRWPGDGAGLAPHRHRELGLRRDSRSAQPA